MKLSISLYYILATLIFVSCLDEKSDPFPNDYLIAQRSYPNGLPDNEVYREAIAWRAKKRIQAQKSLSNEWESLGPYNMAGRITDLELHPEDDRIIYAGSASGGIYKSLSGGSDWVPVFDESSSLSIGDLAISRNNPKLIYAGTGESNAGGGSIAYDGNGIYKSEDGGDQWLSLGPNNVGSIGRVLIDPQDDDRVFAACMGQLFKNNEERGVYRSVNGGSSWERVLFLSDSTGAIDLAMHPENGKIIYAAMWERIRRPAYRQYGGETSGIYKSTDGGDSWTELTLGLPQSAESKGRIGLAISESHPETLYAWYASSQGNIEGIFRTDDAGATWERKSTDGISNVSFMWWFGKIFVDSQDPDKVFATSLNMFYSEDGAESWQQIFNGAHVDHHALAISKQTEGLIYNGNDGGVYSGLNEGKDLINYHTGMANFQFYTCTVDPVEPNNIYGGAQDNGINVSRNQSGNWTKLFGGDGFKVLVDPVNNSTIYFTTQYGNIFRADTTGNNLRFGAIGIFGSFNWNTPLELDAFDSHIIYTGTQRLFRSEDRAENWEVVSPSLVKENNSTGDINFGTLTAIEVSTLDNQIIYVGTDDGNVWVSRDYGGSFEQIDDGLPNRWITSIHADPFNSAGVYICVSGFRFGECDSHVFYSDNYGRDWQPIGSSLPDIPVNDIIADPELEGVLYVATDIGIYTSGDKGQSWNMLGSNLPNVPILDLDYSAKDRFLVAASFGRGMYRYELEDLSSSGDLSEYKINIYPNPSNGEINIDSRLILERITIYSAAGEQVMSFKDKRNFNIMSLQEGIYFLHIQTKQGNLVKKIMLSN